MLQVCDGGGRSYDPAQCIDFVRPPDHARWRQTLTPEGDDIWRRLSDHLPVLVEFDLG